MADRERVAVVGASPNPARYANQAVRLLVASGHDVVPVNPGHEQIESLPCVAALEDIPAGGIDTVTLYLGPARQTGLLQPLLRLQPRRVIFNPGTENPVLAEALQTAGIATEEA